MNRVLNKHEIGYVFQHLDLVMSTSILKEISIYGDPQNKKNRIIFKPHTGPLSIVERNETTILFSSNHPKLYSMDDKGNLIFHHDLLKSSFYLLSGYHEVYENNGRDHWGRVKYEESIQKQLNIIHRPLVNEYFNLILQGINTYLSYHERPALAKRKLFKTFGFLLSHDIDVIDKYGWSHLGYKLKELLGVVKSSQRFIKTFHATIISALQFINPWRANPYWSFEYLMKLEKKHRFLASYYFLSKNKIGGSKYTFSEPRLIQIYRRLKKYNHEIGIHGTNSTVDNSSILNSEIKELEKASGIKVMGGRQHRLWIKNPQTFRNHEEVGLRYDSTLGFAEQEGFRNSFCLPFKPYDFEKQKAIECWQFPLMVMDVTLFSYRQMKPEDIIAQIHSLVDQIAKYNGIFTLLWHNSFFNESLYPGVQKTYESILALMEKHQAEGITGRKLTEKLTDL